MRGSTAEAWIFRAPEEVPPRGLNNPKPRDSNIPQLGNIPEIILGILLSFTVYSLIQGYWSPLNPKPYRSLKGTLGLPYEFRDIGVSGKPNTPKPNP